MRIVFMGTPDFAVQSLRALLEAGHDVCGVFSQPDKPVGRHQNKLKATPVKEHVLTYNAQGHHVPIYQPTKLRDGTALEVLKQLDPQLIVVAAYGRILPDEILALPPKGCINVHSSLLPKFRGAAPINWAILKGEETTGVTIMHMAAQLDAGDIILQQSTPIHPDEDAEMLYGRLAVLGGELLVEAVAQIEAGTATQTAQDHEKATFAPMLSKELSPVDWGRGAREIHDQIRGLMAWPKASTDLLGGDPVKLFRSQVLDGRKDGQPGTILAAGRDGIDVLCGDGRALRILELQPAGGRKMSAADYLRGHPLR